MWPSLRFCGALKRTNWSDSAVAQKEFRSGTMSWSHSNVLFFFVFFLLWNQNICHFEQHYKMQYIHAQQALNSHHTISPQGPVGSFSGIWWTSSADGVCHSIHTFFSALKTSHQPWFTNCYNIRQIYIISCNISGCIYSLYSPVMVIFSCVAIIVYRKFNRNSLWR